MASNFVLGSIGIYKTYAEAVADYPTGLNAFAKKFSKYTCDNSLQYATSPYRDNSFTMRNDESVVSAKYVPEVSFTFFAMNEDIYREFIQLTNTRGFYVRYYDFEIGVDVIRYVYMTDQSRDQIQIAPPDKQNTLGFIQNIIGLKITFVSKLAYDSYEDLVAKAQGDDRMLPRVESPDFEYSSTNIIKTYNSSGVEVQTYLAVPNTSPTEYVAVKVYDAGQDVTSLIKDSSGNALTVYDKSGNALTVYYPTLTISTDTDGATIQYSLDGETWTTYSTPINLSSIISTTTVTLTAKATKSAMNDSYIAKLQWGD